jgi:hypothetical protein
MAGRPGPARLSDCGKGAPSSAAAEELGDHPFLQKIPVLQPIMEIERRIQLRPISQAQAPRGAQIYGKSVKKRRQNTLQAPRCDQKDCLQPIILQVTFSCKYLKKQYLSAITHSTEEIPISPVKL